MEQNHLETFFFWRGVVEAPHPIPKLEDHPLSAVHYSLFDIFAATPTHLEAVTSARKPECTS